MFKELFKKSYLGAKKEKNAIMFESFFFFPFWVLSSNFITKSFVLCFIKLLYTVVPWYPQGIGSKTPSLKGYQNSRILKFLISMPQYMQIT